MAEIQEINFDSKIVFGFFCFITIGNIIVKLSLKAESIIEVLKF